MRPPMRRPLALLAAILLTAAPALAADEVGVRVGRHQGFSRIVFDWPATVGYSLAQEEGRVVVSFDRPGRFAIDALPRQLPPQLLAVEAAEAVASLSVPPRVDVRHFRLGTRVVIDIAELQTAPPTASRRAAAPSPLPLPPPDPSQPPVAEAREREGARAPAETVSEASSTRATASAAADRTAGQTAPAATPSRPAASSVHAAAGAAPAPSAETGGLRGGGLPTSRPDQAPAGSLPAAAPSRLEPATLASLPTQGPHDRSINLPFSPGTGFAVLRRGERLWLVADEPRPIDLRPLRGHPVFGGAEVAITPNATVIRIPASVEDVLRLEQLDRGVRVQLTRPTVLARSTIGVEVLQEGGRTGLRLAAQGANRIVSLSDPDTGERLLVGTLAGRDGGLGVGRAYPEFSLLPTQRGVAILAWSENVTLRVADDGFRVSAALRAREGLSITAATDGVDLSLATRAPTRSFDFPVLSPEAQAERLRLLRGEVAAAAPLARSRPRLLLAETMLAAGLGMEAFSLLAKAAEDDPVLTANTRWIVLAGAAGLLAGRLDEARRLLGDARLETSDELTLWRAWLAHEEGTSPVETAPSFAAAAPLLPAYPQMLARRIAPAAAEAMLEGGQIEVADALLQRLGAWPELLLARAMLEEMRGRIDEALAAYARLDALWDRRQRARGLVRWIELALREQKIGAPEAAARIEPLLYAWRGDAWERALRIRAAELRAAAGDWPGAISLLRETATLFPEGLAEVNGRLAEAFAALFRDGAADTLPPIQAIALFEENADLLPPGPAGDEMVARLAERLVALDLTQRAAATLARLMERQPERGLDRARTGLRLARLLLGDGDAAGALAALAASEPHRPPPALAAERAVLRARALAATGARQDALAMLRDIDSPAALEARADIAFAEGDWTETTEALAALLRGTLPPGERDIDLARRRLILRTAVAASLASDNATLRWLNESYGAAMSQGALSEPFRLLIADPVRNEGDLRRLASDLKLARDAQRSIAALAASARQ